MFGTYEKFQYLCNMGKKKLIVALVGQSGSGKTTLGLLLCKELGYNWISSYTTRPRRKNETYGLEHKFVSESDMPPREDMVAYALFGGYHYWTTFDQFEYDIPNVYVIDEDALVEMEKKLLDKGGYTVIRVYVKRDVVNEDVDEERRLRDEQRTKLPECYYDYVVDNSKSLDESMDYIKREIHPHVDFLLGLTKSYQCS